MAPRPVAGGVAGGIRWPRDLDAAPAGNLKGPDHPSGRPGPLTRLSTPFHLSLRARECQPRLWIPAASGLDEPCLAVAARRRICAVELTPFGSRGDCMRPWWYNCRGRSAKDVRWGAHTLAPSLHVPFGAPACSCGTRHTQTAEERQWCWWLVTSPETNSARWPGAWLTS